jgi:hypothetical protein
LYRSPGITFGSLDYIDERIAALTQRRDRVQSALNEHLRQAEQVLGEAVTK